MDLVQAFTTYNDLLVCIKLFTKLLLSINSNPELDDCSLLLIELIRRYKITALDIQNYIQNTPVNQDYIN